MPNSTKSNYYGECNGKCIFLLVLFFLLFNINIKILSRPIGDHFQVLIKPKKQSHAQLTYIQQRHCVVDRINLSGSEVIIGGFKTIKDFDWIKKLNHALSSRNSHLKIE